MNELSGFTVFEPMSRTDIHLSVRKRTIGITASACKALGSEYVNVFFDERKKRCMLKRAEPTYRNVLRIYSNGKSGRVINNAGVSQTLRRWFGEDARVPGHIAGDGIVIFEDGM